MIAKALTTARQLSSLSLLTFSLSHLLTFSASAADFQVTAYVTITNVPAGPPTNIVPNIGTSDTRTSTNGVVTPSTSFQITNTTAATRTNLVNHLIANPVYSVGVGSPQLVVTLSQTNTSGIEFTAPVNTNLSISFGGNWAKVYYVTNPFNLSNPILVDTNRMDYTSRSNAANAVANLFASLVQPTNSIPPGRYVLRHYTDNTSVGTMSNKTLVEPIIQGGRIDGATNLTATNVTLVIVTITGGNFAGTISSLTNGTLYSNAIHFARITNAFAIDGAVYTLRNGYYTNGRIDRAVATNLVNYGNAFSSPYGVTGGEQFGNGAVASGINATAIGRNALASGVESAAFGYGASATNSSATATGDGATAGGLGSSTYGYVSKATGEGAGNFGAHGTVTGDFSFSFGYFNSITHSNSMVFGNQSASTADNQILIGSSSQSITLSGPVAAPVLTNATGRGINTLNGRLDLTAGLNSTLVNGYNSGVVLGTNTVFKLSGPTLAYTNRGFAAPSGPAWCKVIFSNPSSNLTVMHQDGGEAFGNRINIDSATGALRNYTNNPVPLEFWYDVALQHWQLIDPR